MTYGDTVISLPYIEEKLDRPFRDRRNRIPHRRHVPGVPIALKKGRPGEARRLEFFGDAGSFAAEDLDREQAGGRW